ncbi:hypothetical protein BHM03_00053241 [Ensete ventricosum]|nr:hypothetical protein BHM03_00053241 [Ensete ventricosum]
MVMALGLIAMPTQASHKSIVMSFGWEGRLIVDGVEGLCAADRVVTLVLRVSWFNLSTCSHMKEIAAVIICNVSDKGRLKERVVAAAVRATIGRDNGGQRLRGCRWWHRQPSTTWLAEEEEVNDDGTMSGGCTWLRAMEEDVGVGSAVAMVGGSSGRSNNDEGGSNWPRGCRW